MKGLIQRVSKAEVSVKGPTGETTVVGRIDQGLLLLLGVEKGDSSERLDKLLHKVLNYRIFSDQDDKMNLSLLDIQGGLLVVSQFTLAADTQKGLRPGFSSAAPPELAESLYEEFVEKARERTKKLTKELAREDKQESPIAVETGSFGADMQVSLVNDGPVTFLLET